MRYVAYQLLEKRDNPHINLAYSGCFAPADLGFRDTFPVELRSHSAAIGEMGSGLCVISINALYSPSEMARDGKVLKPWPISAEVRHKLMQIRPQGYAGYSIVILEIP